MRDCCGLTHVRSTTLLFIFLLSTLALAILVWPRPLREIRRLAAEIPSVTVIEVDGYRETPFSEYETIWLELEFEGTLLGFTGVTPASFTEVDHIYLWRFGNWEFERLGFPAGTVPTRREGCLSRGNGVDLGCGGELGSGAQPALRSFPELLARLPEARRIIEAIPDRFPGVRVEVTERSWEDAATGEPGSEPIWIWVHRRPVTAH